MRPLLHARAGAAMVFGIFFAVLFIGFVWSLWGSVETVLLRQRMQDGADAAAFSAAVVNARGMNLIALINMTMAAVLAVLVALRLTQTLTLIALGICTALSSVTGGATSVAVPPLQVVYKGVTKAADKVKDPIEQLLKVLHQVAEVTAKVVPLGANARVIDLVASHHDAFGVAIPTSLTLPVEDDAFAVLCEHAGKIAGQLAILPISPVLPTPVESGFAEATGKLAEAGATWFCGQGGSPPDLNGKDRTRWVELPRFASQDECDQQTQAQVDPNQSDEAYREPCERASAELLASVPDRDGSCRQGEALCPTDCEQSTRTSCPSSGFSDCMPEHAQQASGTASRLFGSGTVQCSGGSQYEQRLVLAREQCRPESEGGREGLGGFAWRERQVVREYVWDGLAAQWREDEGARSEEAPRQVRRKDTDESIPCGKDGLIDEHYERDASLPVCEGKAQCETAARSHGELPCSRVAPSRKGERFRERSTQVVDLLRCAYVSPLPKVETPAMDMSKEFSSEGDTSPMRLEQGKMLGASDFQLRAVVIGKKAPERAQRVVALAWWGGPRGDAVADEGGALVSTATALGRIGLAQAEYYFDWTGLGKDGPKDQTKPADVTEWMWNMAWRARLRPFRMNHDDADPEQTQQPGGGGGGGQGGGADAPGGAGKGLDCAALPKGAGAFCGDATQAVQLLGGGS